MSRPIITVEGLGKQYAIGTKPSSYQTLREALMEGLKAPVRRLRAMRGHATEENLIWALKDVSFEVQEGEVLGIIGRNGAGKSTLLKILSRITDPTEGWAEIRGRVASLLEVGTGFHLELTGRENIYLNGAILGMRKAEIERKFDEIVDFAEIEQFIDTPVKHYSSGMYVRLAFAVAAHLEPEILIVDEVLAVGDAAFQKKCLGKMESASKKQGQTVIFVSHNMPTIQSLCSNVIFLKSGNIFETGKPIDMIRAYLEHREFRCDSQGVKYSHREGILNVVITSVTIATASVATGDDIEILISYQQNTPQSKRIVECGVSIWNDQDVRLISISSLFRNEISYYPHEGTIRCIIRRLPLVSGRYFLNAYVSSTEGIEDYMTHITDFTVNDIDYYGSGKVVNPQWGLIVADHSWNAE